MNVPFGGGCACAAIRYECSAPPLFSANCHCRDCQRASGSAYASLLVVAAEAFRLLSGAPKFHLVTSEGGDPMRRGFCPDCGSPLVIEEPHRPKIVLIQAASLDDPSQHAPQVDIFASRAHPWDVMNPALPKFVGMPPVPDSLGR